MKRPPYTKKNYINGNSARALHVEHHSLLSNTLAPTYGLLSSVPCYVARTASGPGREKRVRDDILLCSVHLPGRRVLNVHAVTFTGASVKHRRHIRMRNSYHRAEKSSVAQQHAPACEFDPVRAITAYADHDANFVPEFRRWVPHPHVGAQWYRGEWPSVFVIAELDLRVEPRLPVSAFHDWLPTSSVCRPVRWNNGP